MKKWVALLIFASFAGMLPLSVRIADPLFTKPFDARIPSPVLMIFSDRVEVRSDGKFSEISPRPKGSTYTFSVPPSQLAWVKEQLKRAPPPRAGSTWNLKIHQIENGKQRIEIEAQRDGIAGLIYDATPDEIVPVASRIAGPGAAFLFALIDTGLCCALWLSLWFSWWLITRPKVSKT
jgi:hypothetical protein